VDDGPRVRVLTAARRFLGGAAVDGFFNGLPRVARLHPQARPSRHAVEHLRDLRYFDGRCASTCSTCTGPRSRPPGLHAGAPPAFRRYHGPPWPMVFYIHGGGFRILSKDTHWVMGLAFARRGFVVFNTSYRLAPKHRFPCAIEDVCRSFVWAIRNAARFGADPTLAYERAEPWAKQAFATGVIPKAVVPACGVFQVSDMARLSRRKPGMSAFIADRLREVESAYLGPDAPACSTDLADPLLLFERGERPARPPPRSSCRWARRIRCSPTRAAWRRRCARSVPRRSTRTTPGRFTRSTRS